MSHIDYNEDNPGPNHYWLNYKWVLPQAPIQSIAIKTIPWFDYGKPGPGTYNLRKDGNDSPKYTMAQHCHGITPLNVPGPGTYFLHQHIKHTNIRVPAHTIADRNYPDWDQGFPGPGTYNLREEVPENIGYSIGKRFATRTPDTPGPGTFSPRSESGSPKHSIGHHLREQSRPTTPGVGAYNLRSQEFAGPRYTMGRKFYRLRDMKRERRWSRILRHDSPKRGKKIFIDKPEPPPPIEIHRKHRSHIHVKPEIPHRRASTAPAVSKPVDASVQVDPSNAPGAEALPTLAAPVVPVVPVVKSNQWMDVGKRLLRTREAITAAATAAVATAQPPPELGEPAPPPAPA